MTIRAALIASGVALGAAAACDQPPVCYDGDYQACSCGPKRGYRRCEAQALGACVCDGTTPGLTAIGGGAMGGGGTGGMGPAKAALYAPCKSNADCASGDCNNFPSKGGLHCSKSCKMSSECPPPSPGCN